MSDATPRAGLRRPAPLQWHRLRPAPLYGIDSGQFAAHLHRSTSSLIAVSAARTLYSMDRLSQLLRLRLSHQGGAGVRPASAQHPGRVPRPGELALRDCGSQAHDARLQGSPAGWRKWRVPSGCHAKLGSRIKLDQIAW
ncbi:unnamed protein product [Musa acuminata subsp. burmannicoides]